MRILFLCEHNRFRSKVAETIFNRLNKNSKIKTKSAGTKPDYLLVARNVKKALKRFGAKRINPHPKKLTKSMIKEADLIVIIANNIKLNKKDAGRKKVLVWKISDTSQNNYKGILKRTKEIVKRVKKLIYMLN